MKLKFLTPLLFVGIAFIACTSNKNADGELDSNRVDTTMQSPTTTATDTTMVDTTTKVPDTIPRDKKN